MNGKFTPAAQVMREQQDWGILGWLSRPSSTGAKHLTVIEVTLLPGQGHNFHKHPDQEEIIYAIEGTVEQWIEREKRLLDPGDSAFIPANVVHASFNSSSSPIKLIAILGPCVGEGGYELVEVFDQAPWKDLR